MSSAFIRSVCVTPENSMFVSIDYSSPPIVTATTLPLLRMPTQKYQSKKLNNQKKIKSKNGHTQNELP